MRRPALTTLFLASILVAAACAPAPPPPPPAPSAPAGPTPAEMMSAAAALDQRFVDAFNKADVDALMATYWNSPDLVSYGPDGMGTRGWDAAKTATVETFKAIPGATLELVNPRNDVHGGVVLGSGTWKMTIPAAKGPATVLVGRFSDAKALKDGKWVYLMDHASVPLPPPPDAGKGK
jgi:ketosteroid isomerase-like protein